MIERDSYLENGTMLVQVLDINEHNVIVEDCSRPCEEPRYFKLSYEALAQEPPLWRKVAATADRLREMSTTGG